MSMRLAATSTSRQAQLQRLLTSRAPGPLSAAVSSGSSCSCAGGAVPQLQRRFRAGHGFEGFFGGGGFPGGHQQPPPRGDSEKFYKLLDISKGASEAEIKSAYKKKAMKHHPDRGGDEGTFKEISRAYEVLSDSNKRQLYDQYGEEGLNNMEQGGGGGGGPQGGMDPFDLFSQIFGFNAAGARARGKPRSPDQAYAMQVTLEEIYTGTARNIAFTRDVICKSCDGVGGHEKTECPRCNGTGVVVKMQQMGLFVQQTQSPCGHCGAKGYIIPPGKSCSSCNGKGTVKEKKTFSVDVEPGIKENSEFRFRGQADEAPGHDTGDVVISIKEKPHKTYQRLGDNLIMSKKLTLDEALCGFEFSTTFLDGEELVVRSKPGQVVKPGDVVTIVEKGLPRPHGQRPGNLFVTLNVDFPESLSPEAQQEVSKALGGKPLSDTPPPNASEPRKLTRRESETLKQQLAQRGARGAGGQQAQCQQM